MAVTRYHPTLVVLHWLSAVLLLLALGMGSQVLAELPNTAPDKLGALKGHMLLGGVILLLTLTRLLVRQMTAHPPAARSGMAWADRLAPQMHGALYVLVLIMVGSGIAMSLTFDLPSVVFGGQGSLPPDFHVALARRVHGAASKLLGVFILLHVAAALFHQFVKRDALLTRMGFGLRK
jgi:cytochrome b561